MGVVASFYALQPRMWTPNRLYKMFVTPDALCAARVAGQMYSEQSGNMQLVGPAGLLGLLMVPLVRRAVRQRAEQEARYDGIDPTGPDFLEMHPHNFMLDKHAIQGASLRHNSNWWWVGDMPHAGTLEIQPWDGKPLRFVLVEEESPLAVRDKLARLIDNIDWSE